MQSEVLKRNLKAYSQAVNSRVTSGELTDAEGRRLLSEYANKLLDSVKIERIFAAEAHEYGELFRTARRWDLARQAFSLAVEDAERRKNEDRRVNDTLHLAESHAQLGNFAEAIANARKTFGSKPEEKAPILMSVLYEIVPPIAAKGPKLEAAKLLGEAIEQHRQVIVDPGSDAGKQFLEVRPIHLRRAWKLAIELYESAGEQKLASAARVKARAMLADQVRL